MKVWWAGSDSRADGVAVGYSPDTINCMLCSIYGLAITVNMYESGLTVRTRLV